MLMENIFYYYYFQILCLVRAKSAGDYHRRVAIDTIVMMTSQNKCLSDVYLFQPLTSPLHHLQQGMYGEYFHIIF